MLSDNSLTVYDSWEIYQPIIPTRSHLFPLKPVGVGTPQIESLTSYITRLSEAHCLLPRTLIAEILALSLKNTFAKKRTSRGLRSLFERANTINGSGDIAQDFVDAVEVLTCSQNLRLLTLLTWSKVFAWQGLLRTHKAWCSACYHEWLESGSVIYEPLLWSIKTVKVCPRHRVTLLEQCPHCQQRLFFLSWRSRSGFCSECHQLLVDLSQITLNQGGIQRYSENELEKYSWTANSFGYLLAQSPVLNSLPSKSIVRDNLVLAVDILTDGNMAALASSLGIPKNTFWGWYTGKSFPTIDSLLEIAWRLNTSLFDLVTQKIELSSLKTISCQALPGHAKPKRLSPRSFDSWRVQQALLNALAQPESDVPTIKQISESLGCDRRLISKHFPDLCRAVVLKRRNWQKSNLEQTIQDCCTEIRQAVLTLYAQRQYPSEARVSRLMSHPGFFRYQRVRDCLHAARCELGLES